MKVDLSEQEAIELLDSFYEKDEMYQAAQVAIKALKETQKYQEIGSAEKIKEELDRLRNDNDCQGLYFTLEERQDLARQHRELEHYRELENRLSDMFSGELTLSKCVDELELVLKEPDKPHPINAKILTYEDAAKWEAYKSIGTPEECLAAVKFKEYFDKLYGAGLEVANLHQNGDIEPFDNFYKSALLD